MSTDLNDSGCGNRKEFAISTFSTQYRFRRVGISKDYCKNCLSGGTLQFINFYQNQSLIPREKQASEVWTKIFGEGAADPTQALSAFLPKNFHASSKDGPETVYGQPHFMTDRRILDPRHPGTECGSMDCIQKCPLCYGHLPSDRNEKNVILTSLWPSVYVHAKCCSKCTFPSCDEMVPSLPTYLTTDDKLQRCPTHTESSTKPLNFTGSLKQLAVTTPVPKSSGKYRVESHPYKAPARYTKHSDKYIPNKDVDIRSMFKSNATFRPPPLSLITSFDYTPPCPTRFDIPEPVIDIAKLTLSDTSTKKTSNRPSLRDVLDDLP